MNIAKTKCMSLGTDINHLEMDSGDSIAGCIEFSYRGSVFTEDGRDSKNIRHRVGQAIKIIGTLNGIWWAKGGTKTGKR